MKIFLSHKNDLKIEVKIETLFRIICYNKNLFIIIINIVYGECVCIRPSFPNNKCKQKQPSLSNNEDKETNNMP